jgi:1-acyl-sn-glycerol-3-phosphate acyltransferase
MQPDIKSRVTDTQSQVTDHQPPITDSPSPITDPRDSKKYYMHRTLVRYVVESSIEGILSLLGVLHTIGGEKLPPDGPVIVASNHITNFDVFPLQFALSRPLFYMGKEELFRNPAMDWLLRQLGGFPVYRGARDEWAMRHAEKLLEQGNALGIFPEGTRSKGRGLSLAKTGAARLAKAVQCPIVPVALYGTQVMFHHFPHRAEVVVTVGNPIYPKSSDTSLDLTDQLMFALAGMLPVEFRGVYQVHPPGF